MTATVRCAHLATLDLDLDCAIGCPPAVTYGRWSVGAASDLWAKAVLADLVNGVSVGGALLRLADQHPETGPIFAADGIQFAALATGGQVHHCNPVVARGLPPRSQRRATSRHGSRSSIRQWSSSMNAAKQWSPSPNGVR